MLKLFIASRNASIKEVHFPAVLGAQLRLRLAGSDPRSRREVPRQRSQRRPARHARRQRTKSRNEDEARRRRSDKEQKAKPKPQLKREAARQRRPGPRGRSRRSRGRRASPARSAAASRSSTRRGLPPAPSSPKPTLNTSVDPRVYHLRDKDEESHPAYRMVGTWRTRRRPHYFGIQGIHGWEDPPILDNPTVTETIHDREFDIYIDSGRIKLIAWHRGENTYWVSNDLLQTLSNDQMIGIATLGQGAVPKKQPRKRQAAAVSEQQRAGRGDRGRLGRPGDRRLLRRARPPGDRPRHPPREGRVAARAAR